MFERLGILVALAGASCTSTGGSGGATGFDGQPCSQYHLCVQAGAEFNCDCGGGTSLACPSALPEQPCQSSEPACMGCSQGAGYYCSCQDAGLSPDPDAALWVCIGTENACR